MRRDLARLTAERYDAIVVGGGIHGACAAWEAALRGLKVALIEARDFGHATSSNSLRTLHGGLRHLQRLDVARMRESIRERRQWLRLAPHCASPMRFVLPTTGHAVRGPTFMRAALWINDLVGLDRNRGVRPDRWLPRGSVWSRAQLQSSFAGVPLTGSNGAAAWYDAICLNTERLQIAVVAAAVAAGAHAANYVRAVRLVVDDGRVCGLGVRDELTGRELELRARFVINAAGPWVDEWLRELSRPPRAPMFHASKAFNLLTRPLLFRDALGLSVASRRRSITSSGRPQTYFIVPWHGYSLVGTRHLRCDHSVRSVRISREEVLEFLVDLNGFLGEHRLAGTDVAGVFAGLLPEEADNVGPEVALQRASRVIDHSAEGVSGLLSIVGVKWTTARAAAERAVGLVCKQLSKSTRSPTVRGIPSIAPAPAAGHDAWERPDLDPRVLIQLEESYGPARDSVLALMREDATLTARVVPDLPVVMGQVLQAARAEMAMRLSDVIRRRTPLYLSAALDRSALSACAGVMMRELRWSRREIGKVWAPGWVENPVAMGPPRGTLAFFGR